MKWKKVSPLLIIVVLFSIGAACNFPSQLLESSSSGPGGVQGRIEATFQARTQQAGSSEEDSSARDEVASTPYSGNSSTHRLTPGETAQGIDGVTLAATDQALEKPVDVTITRVEDPEAGNALGPERVGAYYQLTANAEISAGMDSPLFIALPVPEGEAFKNLGVAMLGKRDEFAVETQEELETEPSLEDRWMFRSASIDQEDRLVVITFFHIPEQGRLFTMVRDKAFTPSLSSAGKSLRMARPSREEEGPFFKAVCYPDGFEGVSWECTSEDQEKAAVLLENAYQKFIDLGFKKPFIYHNYKVVSSLPQDVPNTDTGARQYVISLISCPALNGISQNAKGLYRGAGGPLDILICYDATRVKWRGGKAVDAKNKADLIEHEVFHGVQFAYSGYRRNHQAWFTEGTATAAMMSNNVMSRKRRARHDIDLNLGNTSQKYRAQDFWVFTGNNLGKGLDYLIPFLEQGADTESIDSVLESEYGSVYPSGLSDAYWAWAKFQAFEGKAGGKCALNPEVVQAAKGEHALLTSNIRGPQTVTVGPRRSQVIRYNLFRLSDSPSVKYQYTLRASPGASESFSKFYYQVNAGSDHCLSRPDRAKQFAVEVPPSVEYTNAYALISNGRPDLKADFQLSVTAHKYQISITSPADNSNMAQGESANFGAAFTEDGALQDGAVIKWTVGSPLSQGGGVVGQGRTLTLSSDQIGGPGTYDIYANHVGNPPREAIYDSVTVSVQAAQAPEVTINHPDDDAQVYATSVGGSYQYGEQNTVIFTARGEARDAEGDPITGDDLIWSYRCLGCSGWNTAGRGENYEFQLQDEQCGPTGYQLRLVAWDQFGNMAQQVIDILVNVTGC